MGSFDPSKKVAPILKHNSDGYLSESYEHGKQKLPSTINH